MARIINFSTTPADPGEAQVINHLAANLPDSFLLIPNIELSEHIGKQLGQPFEYDLVCIAAHAVYAIEVKRWLGRIEGDDYDWILNGRSRRPNPVRLVNRKARVLKEALLRYDSTMKHVWVEGCVLIADERASLALVGDCAGRTFRYTDAPNFLGDASRVNQQPNSLRSAGEQILRALRGGGKARSPQPLKFNDYQITETLGSSDFVIEYLARHEILPGSVYRLRVFSISPYLPEDEARRRRDTITRDFQALRAIGDHPNLLPVRDFFSYNGHSYVEVTDWSNEGTLRKLLSGKSAPLTLERKLEITIGLANGLAAAHSQQILHRDVRPENVLMAWNLTPRLMNFDRARIAREGYETVWEGAAHDLDQTYLPPELIQPKPQPVSSSDLYSLGLIAYELFIGHLPYASLSDFLNLGGRLDALPDALPPGLPDGLRDILARLIVADPSGRYVDAPALITDLQRLMTSSANGKALERTTTTKDHYEEKDTIAIDYRVLKPLGKGGLAQVYHVLHLIQEQEFALKLMNAQVDLVRLQTEFKVMRELKHPHIAEAIWAGSTGKQYYLVAEYIEGETLAPYSEHKKRLSPSKITELICQLLDALAYMHPKPEAAKKIREEYGSDLTEEQLQQILAAEQGVYHRDIKPANLMLTRGGVKLIDFNIAVWAQSIPPGLMGTPAYMPPDVSTGGGYDASCDLFAVGVVMYELITGQHPYPEGTPAFATDPTDPRTYIPNLSTELVTFLLKAVAPHRQMRFRTANEMLKALESISNLEIQPQLASTPESLAAGPRTAFVKLLPDEAGRLNYNPYLTRFLALYSQARVDNSGTRGLDDIALATYVSTRLDRALQKDILEGRHRLVIITGNAGDGKTAFIQQVETEAARLGATPPPSMESKNGNHFRLNGLEFATNYDGSQDESGRVNDDVLADFFAPFAGVDVLAQAGNRVRVIAINEGRLREFFSKHAAQYSALQKIVSDYFEPEGPAFPSAGLLFVNLNWRSVVAGGEQSIFTRQVRALIDNAFWEPCNACDFRDRCPAKFNVDTLRDPVSGPQVQERLRTLFEIVSLRRQQHITMRDLRSALSYLLFCDRNCAEIIATIENGQDPLMALSFVYYNGLAAPDELTASEDKSDSSIPLTNEGSIDRLIRLLTQVDIALVANPADDRELHFEGPNGVLLAEFMGRSSYESDLLEAARDSLPIGWAITQDPALQERHRRLHRMLRRKVFFERRDNWRRMLPFNEVTSFQKATQEEDDAELEKLRRSLIKGISAAEGCRDPQLSEQYVCLRAGVVEKPTIKSFRLFKAEDFYIHVPDMDDRYLEYIPDSLLFRHRVQSGSDKCDAELRVTIDLLELLTQIEHGFVPSLNDLRGAYVNLLIFRNALAHLRYLEVLLVDDDGMQYNVSVDNQNVIQLQQVPSGS